MAILTCGVLPVVADDSPTLLEPEGLGRVARARAGTREDCVLAWIGCAEGDQMIRSLKGTGIGIAVTA